MERATGRRRLEKSSQSVCGCWCSNHSGTHPCSTMAQDRPTPPIAGGELQSSAEQCASIERAWRGQWLSNSSKGTGQDLQARGAALPPGHRGGYVVAFDGVTQLVHGAACQRSGPSPRPSAPRDQEPLTPIQLRRRPGVKLRRTLGAEGTRKPAPRYGDHRQPGDRPQAMVDDFSEYARLPPPELKRLGPFNDPPGGRACGAYENSQCRWRRVGAASCTPVWADGATERQVIPQFWCRNAQDSGETSPAERRARRRR